MTYVRDFVHCRRPETLLCWDDEDGEGSAFADVLYAAAMAGSEIRSP